jgi:uncharacterized protein
MWIRFGAVTDKGYDRCIFPTSKKIEYSSLMQRRKFLHFLGTGTVSLGLLPPILQSCTANKSQRKSGGSLSSLIKGIEPSLKDELVLADGLHYEVLISYNDPINDTEFFGFNNDYTAFLPDGPDKGMLWVNHEYPDPLLIHGHTNGPKSRSGVEKEMLALGGSILHIERVDGHWRLIKGAPNKRIHGLTPIPFNWDEPIVGSREAIGTFQNCSGGVTPWGTILTCEENYQDIFGEVDRHTGLIDESFGTHGWSAYYNHRPEHYGWVVEVDPQTGAAKKHVALGRFCHECATIVELEDGRVVVYSGDDKVDQFMYKFISSSPGSLKEGTLYVADTVNGIWIPLTMEDERLSANFKDLTEVMIYCREAAALLGATPLDRPEDIDIDPVTGHVLITCTNNKAKGNYYGQIIKIIEDNNDYASLTFKAETFLTGGKETGFACPDNMAFDQGGNLWFASDISGGSIDKGPYEGFGNNGLYVVPRTGPQAGEIIQVASGPVSSELTGPFFHPDGKTLFISVQHPGETSKSMDALTSHWPNGGDSMPLCSVVCITGPLLETLNLL